MGNILFQNCEQAISYMLQHLRLSRVDFKFLDSVSKTGVRQNSITTNQVELFKKIVYKYRKQLEKLKFSVIDIIELPWHCKVIPSSPEFTEAYISIVDNLIKLKAPYNKNFIVATRKEPIPSMKWDKVERLYTINYGTYAFKELYHKVKEHFSEVNYCVVSKRLLDYVEKYNDVLYWNPNLVYKNNRFFICAANESLMESINHIELNIEPQTIADLVFHGIRISDSVLNILREKYPTEFVNFISDPEPIIEAQKIELIIEWLSMIGCDVVYEVNKMYRFGEKFNSNYYETFKKYSIPIIKNAEADQNKSYKRPVSFSYTTLGFGMNRPNKLFKIIKFVNSQPVNIL